MIDPNDSITLTRKELKQTEEEIQPFLWHKVDCSIHPKPRKRGGDCDCGLDEVRSFANTLFTNAKAREEGMSVAEKVASGEFTTKCIRGDHKACAWIGCHCDCHQSKEAATHRGERGGGT